MAINPPTDGVNNLHDVDLLSENHDNGGDVRAPALPCVFAPCDLRLLTWQGVALGTTRFVSGLKALKI
jgi:hypothetical protein